MISYHGGVAARRANHKQLAQRSLGNRVIPLGKAGRDSQRRRDDC
jgi:hypothetical protein